MFEEMAVLVDAQGEMLDAIEVWTWNMFFLEWKNTEFDGWNKWNKLEGKETG